MTKYENVFEQNERNRIREGNYPFKRPKRIEKIKLNKAIKVLYA
jgi:hypothetical protein